MPAIQDRTISPPDDDHELQELDDLVTANETAELHGPDGRVTTVPSEIYDVLREVVSALRTGQAITVAHHHAELTTQEAADLLGISRPTLIKRLDRDDIPFTRPGRHRRLRLMDVLAYRQSLRDRRREGIKKITSLSEDAGLYDLAPDEIAAAADDVHDK